MSRYLQLLFLSFLILTVSNFAGKSQSLESLGFKFTNGLEVGSIRLSISEDIVLIPPSSLFSVEVNGKYYSSKDVKALLEEEQIRLMFPNGIIGSLKSYGNGAKGWKGVLKLRNRSPDTLTLENVVPFGATDDHVVLTSGGPSALARAIIYIPDMEPVSVILPDNAWEMGYGAKQLDDNYSVGNHNQEHEQNGQKRQGCMHHGHHRHARHTRGDEKVQTNRWRDHPDFHVDHHDNAQVDRVDPQLNRDWEHQGGHNNQQARWLHELPTNEQDHINDHQEHDRTEARV